MLFVNNMSVKVGKKRGLFHLKNILVSVFHNGNVLIPGDFRSLFTLRVCDFVFSGVVHLLLRMHRSIPLVVGSLGADGGGPGSHGITSCLMVHLFSLLHPHPTFPWT